MDRLTSIDLAFGQLGKLNNEATQLGKFGVLLMFDFSLPCLSLCH